VAPQDRQEVAELGRIAVHSASQAVAQMLRNAIISGTLKPGERLVELKLAAKMGVGQPTLREALKELEYEGFVKKIPQRGTYVTKLDKEDYCKVLTVRIALEGRAVGLATRNMTPDAESEIKALVDEMGRATAKADLAEFHEMDVAFHRKIWDLAGNEFLTRALEAITFPLFAFALLNLGPELMNHRQAAVRQHEGILAGIRSHDPAGAYLAFVTHTVRYWNETYHLDLKQDEILMPFSIPAPPVP